MTATLQEKLESQSEWRDGPLYAPGPCLVWKGTQRNRRGGYGVTSFQGRRMSVHRAAWIEYHGHEPPPDRPHILHRCDRPTCIAIAHLYAGTPADNTRDRIERKGHFQWH